MTHQAPDRHDDEHDRGFAHDRHRLWPPSRITRRAALSLFAGSAAGVTLLKFSGADAEPDTKRTGASTGTSSTGTSKTSATPTETSGPYPADGSNGPDVLDDSGVVRRDIRSSFGSAGGRADGVGLQIALSVVHAATSKPYPTCAVYLWHCDQLGRYSLYSDGVTDQNYLRGIQVADANGRLRFRSIFPACYSGRWPHVHFEIYPSLKAARSGSNRVLTSQLALPRHACEGVYRDQRYTGSADNLSQVSLSTDLVFSDGWSAELAGMSGSIGNGYTASLTIAV